MPRMPRRWTGCPRKRCSASTWTRASTRTSPRISDALPSKPRRALEQKLEFQLRGSSRIDDAAVARAFRVFLSTTVSSYRKHVVPETSERRIPTNAPSADGLWLDQNAFEAAAATRRTKMMLGNLRGTRLYEVFVRGRLEVIARDPKQTGFLGARLGNSTAGESVKGSLMGGGGGSSSGGELSSSGLNSAVSAEAALLAYAAEDFQHELPQDAALTAVYRAGSASAAAGAASAAAATTRAAAQAAKSAAWGAKTRRRCSTRSWGAPARTARRPTATPRSPARPRACTAAAHTGGTTVRSRAATTRTHRLGGPRGARGRSSASTGSDETMNDKTRRRRRRRNRRRRRRRRRPPPPRRRPRWRDTRRLTEPQLRLVVCPSTCTRARTTRGRRRRRRRPRRRLPPRPPRFRRRRPPFGPSGSASEFDSGSGAGIPSRQSSSGSMAAAVAAATARRALSPTGTAGTSSPQFSPTANAAFPGNGVPAGNETAAVDPFAAAVLGNAPPRAPGCADEQTHALARGLGGLRRGDAGGRRGPIPRPRRTRTRGVPGVALGGERGVPFERREPRRVRAPRAGGPVRDALGD